MCSSHILKLFTILLFLTISESRHYGKSRFSIRNKQNLEMYEYAAYNLNQSIDREIEGDLGVYLKVLRNIIEFCHKNKENVRSSVAFGLFHTGVNLKLAIKKKTVPKHVLEEINKLLAINTEVLNLYYNKLNHKLISDNIDGALIWKFWDDDSAWVERIEEFQPLMLDNHNGGTDSYPSSEQYVEAVYDFESGKPNPEHSDRCLASARMRDVQIFDSFIISDPVCSIDHECYAMLINGTDFGYALTHRVLWILMTRYGLGCAILSPHQDRQLSAELCSKVYREAHFLLGSRLLGTMTLMDLFLEQIGVCSLAGHKEFLQRSWLMEALKMQQKDGSFNLLSTSGLTSQEAEKTRWHMTGVAGLVYSCAVRTIVTQV